MKNKTLFASLVLFIFTASSATAMPPFGGACSGSDSESLQRQLELSDEQSATLQTILEERFQSRLLLHKRHHDEMDQHRAETLERLSAVLSETQIEQLEAYRLWHERTGRPGGRR
ncbi:MAG: hypothetical protein B6D72_08145 [gamma proteobacterium symbiont of Ctena orbiculata]|nr:hypothetical protein [Candidatus Thiodiazotropha taylori]PVV12285.1 MAG: hypothetical protein B6D72_08145 [gamma proteobacterium symbiont of Ctena orbiculata]MBT2995566.1 hypothetical protein [Candidatus Thiodiazotropha taylori]MBT2999480.1 hypothetical protein [Candidatus Thiodiazotropha taylori]MBV2106573.1 hypothetical protein [Candidatus Thiodiazotropha taylori]